MSRSKSGSRRRAYRIRSVPRWSAAWPADYNLVVGMAKGRVKAKGPVNNILKLVPLCKPLSPVYREMIAEKDAAAV